METGERRDWDSPFLTASLSRLLLALPGLLLLLVRAGLPAALPLLLLLPGPVLRSRHVLNKQEKSPQIITNTALGKVPPLNNPSPRWLLPFQDRVLSANIEILSLTEVGVQRAIFVFVIKLQ